MMYKSYWFLTIVLCLFLSMCTSHSNKANDQHPVHEEITVNQSGYDIYGQDCSGGISIHVKDASISKNMIGKTVFIKPSNIQFKLPQGLIGSGNNKFKFHGSFKNEKCIHLMVDHTKPELNSFFVYDSVDIICPYIYFDIQKKQLDSPTCKKHISFHKRIKIVE